MPTGSSASRRRWWSAAADRMDSLSLSDDETYELVMAIAAKLASSTDAWG